MLGPSYTYAATVREVIDGDTYVLDVKTGFRHHVDVRVRLRGWNCAERFTPEGKLAKTEAIAMLPPGTPVVIQTELLRSGAEAMTFERYVADVWLDNVHVGERLAAKGLAVRAKG